jgi:Fe-S-cluster containining protein
MRKFFDGVLLAVKKRIAKWQKNSYVREGKCNQCGACCTMVTLFIEGRPICTEEQFSQLKEVFPEYERFYIRDEDEHGHLLFTCRFLGKDYTCGDYKKRPFICRQYPSEKIFLKGGKLISGCGFRFIPVEDFGKIIAEANSTSLEENNE